MTVNKRISRTTAILAITSALVIACGGPAAVDSTSAPNTQIVRDPDNSSAKAFVAPALRDVSARSARILRDPDNAAAAARPPAPRLVQRSLRYTSRLWRTRVT